MEQLELKYKTEVNKNSSLLRMNSSLMTKNDLLNSAIHSIHLLFYPPDKQYSLQHEFEQEEIKDVVQLVRRERVEGREGECGNCEELEEQMERMRRNGGGENEERWKGLYNKESEETYRLSKVNAELMDVIREFTVSRNRNQEQLKVFLEEYLELYKKVNIVEIESGDGTGCQETVRENSTTKKKERANSIRNSRKSQEKKGKERGDKERTVILEESREIREGRVEKQWRMLVRLRESAVEETEVVRKELVEILKTLKLSEENCRYLKSALKDSIYNSF